MKTLITALMLLGVVECYAQSAGPDQTICQYGLATMAATGTGAWSALATNPTTTTIVNATSATTGIFGFSTAGVYSFVWTSGGMPDTMTVTVPNAAVNTISVSPDSIILAGQSATLTANPAAIGGNYQWSPTAYINPSTGTTQTEVASPTTTTSFCVNYTVSGCQTTKCQTIHVVTVYAGPDQTVCQYSDATMAALGTGVWIALASNPTISSFTNNADPNAVVSGLTMAGVYGYVWTSGSNRDTMFITVNAKPNAGFMASDSITCSSNPTPLSLITYTDTTSGGVGTHQWSVPSALNPSNAAPGNMAAFSTQYGAQGYGAVQMIVTDATGSCSDTAYSTVHVVNPVADYTLPILSDTFASCPPLIINPFMDSSSNDIAHYRWNFGDGTQYDTAINAAHIYAIPGVYPATEIVTSSHGCVDSITKYTITVGGIQIQSVVNNSSCGNNDGSICLNVVNGIAPYTYTFQGIGGSVIDSCMINLTPGVYTEQITDASGCAVSHIDTIGQLSQLVITDTIINATCNGGVNGNICLTVSGGTAPYTYNWSNGVSGTINCINSLIPAVYSVSVSDANGCSAVQNDTVGQAPPMVFTDSVQNASCAGANDGGIYVTVTGGTLNPGGAYVYVWSNTSTVATTYNVGIGTYCLTVVDNLGCSALFCDSVKAGNDCIWPGDADANGLVDNNDLLPIGVGYDSTGTARSSVSIVWQADGVADWANTFSSYTPAVNYKHADCNGDGVINADDTLAITQNFGFTHAKNGDGPTPWRSGIPGLKAVLSTDSLYTGDTLTVTFVLGDPATPANNVYGLAFTYNFDPLVIDSTMTTMTFGSSWLGNNDKISISKTLNSGQIKAAITRIDHITRSGNGPIAAASFKITTDNISGKDFEYYVNTGFISDITAIDQYGNPIALNAGADTSEVGYTPTGIREVTTEKVSLYPNPTHDRVTISAENPINDISITNVAGQEVYHKTGINAKSTNIDVSMLVEGLYFVQIKTNKCSGTAKLSVVR